MFERGWDGRRTGSEVSWLIDKLETSGDNSNDVDGVGLSVIQDRSCSLGEDSIIDDSEEFSSAEDMSDNR